MQQVPHPPAMAMIDAPDGARYYLIPPAPPGRYKPTIALLNGVLRPCYTIPDRLGSGSVYSEGSARVVKRDQGLLGVLAALHVLETLWRGVIDSHPGASDDIAMQERLAKALTGPPEAAYALMEKSGVLGREGMPKRAADLVRNVFALAHWKALWKIRRVGQSTRLDGQPQPGGLHWKTAAAMMNAICREAFPDIGERQWKPFTATTLKGLADRYLLDPRVQK